MCLNLAGFVFSGVTLKESSKPFASVCDSCFECDPQIVCWIALWTNDWKRSHLPWFLPRSNLACEHLRCKNGFGRELAVLGVTQQAWTNTSCLCQQRVHHTERMTKDFVGAESTDTPVHSCTCRQRINHSFWDVGQCPLASLSGQRWHDRARKRMTTFYAFHKCWPSFVSRWEICKCFRLHLRVWKKI